jgi:hypothetical protein
VRKTGIGRSCFMHEPKAMREIKGLTAGAAKGAALIAGAASGWASWATKLATDSASPPSNNHASLSFIRL